MALTKIPGELFSVGDLDISDVGTISLDAIEGDADSNTSITFSGSDVITIATGGSNRLTIGDGALSPVTDNQIDLGTSSLEFKDAFFDGTVTSDAFAGPLTGDVTGNVSGTAATVTGAAQSNITSLGTLTTLTVDNVIVNGTTIGHTSDTDLMTLADGVLTVAGEVDATSLDISGDVDVDGTLETDNLTVGGAQGSDGQVLTSTGSGVAWEDASSFNADAAQVFNESGAAVDFRIEGDTEQNLFFVDGSEDKIGIGTASPSVPLDILTNLSSDTTSTPDTVLTLSTKYASTGSNGAAGAGTRLEFKIPDDETNPITGVAIAGIKEAADDSDASAGMAFYVSQNDTTLDEAMRIDHDGNIGFGLTAPTFATGNGMHFADSFYVGLGTGNGTRPDFSLSGNNSGLAIACGTGSDDADILISTAGVMAVPNGIELGSGTDFTSANTLNDYEEGDWTPTVGGASGAGSTSGGAFYGKYIKIGKLVFASFSIANTTISSASGHLTIGGFPFNNSGTGDREANGCMRVYGVNLEALGSNTSPIPAVNNNTNTAYVLQSKDDAAWSVVQVSNDSGQYFEGSITYIAT